MEKICGVYKITNTINNKVYIGQSVNIYKRWNCHKAYGTNRWQDSPERDYPLYRAMRKYGVENFTFEIISSCSVEELNDMEEHYIRKYNSDSAEHGYNCRKQYYTRKLSPFETQKIMFLLHSSSLTYGNIADIMKIGTKMISQINNGQLHHDKQQQYPIRSKELNQKLQQIIRYAKRGEINLALDTDFLINIDIDSLYKKCKPAIESAISLRGWQLSKQAPQSRCLRICRECGQPISTSSQSGLCRECYDAQKVNKLPKEHIGFELIKHILDSSLESVAREYGYASGNSIKKLLKREGLPYRINDMLDYYEKQTGHIHPQLQRKKLKQENKRKSLARRVGQYDDSFNLVNIYPSTKEAFRETNISSGAISQCCRGEHKHAGGFIWRYIDSSDYPISPNEVASYPWHYACDICGSDTGSSENTVCPRCSSLQRVFDREQRTLQQILDILHEYPLAQAAKICSCDIGTLYNWFEEFGISKEQVKQINNKQKHPRVSI